MRNCNNSYHLHLAVVAVCTLLYLVLEKLYRLYYFVLFELDVGRALGGAVFGPAVHEKS